MKRVVGSRVGQVENEGLVLVFVFVEAVDGVISEGIRMIKLFVRAGVSHDHFALDGPTADAGLAFSAWRSLAGAGLEPWIEEVAATVRQSVVAVKSTSGGEGHLMPFT